MSNQAVFLDRDGTLIEHYDYLTDASQVHLLPRTASALRLLKEHGYLLVLVTNQSAVARGMLTEETLFEIHDKLKEQLAEQGVYLDQIYYCPFHPEGVVEKYRRESEMRKPAPGMLKLAAKEMDIDLARSWAVGDDDRDIQAGEGAGCKTIQIDSHTTSSFVHRGQAKPDYRAVNLQEAANLILRFSDRREHRGLPVHRFYEPESEGKESETRRESEVEPAELRTHPAKEKRAVATEKETRVEETTPEAPRSATQAKPVSIKTRRREKTAKVKEAPAKVVEASDEPIEKEPRPEHRFAQPGEEILRCAQNDDAKAAETVTKEASPSPVSHEEPSSPGTVVASKSVSIKDVQGPEEESVKEESEPEEREDFAKAVRDTEIARRKEQKKLIEKSIKLRDPLAKKLEEEVEEGADGIRHLLAQILRELKASNRQQHFTEFSISKLLAGVTQMLVILCLILSFWFVSRADPKPANAQACLLVALVLQTLTLTLLTMHKS